VVDPNNDVGPDSAPQSKYYVNPAMDMYETK